MNILPILSKSIQCIDLIFMNMPGVIAVYLVKHDKGGILVECGPSSTIPRLLDGLAQNGLEPGDITDVLLTHIHLDHAGAAGWLARHGARIHVHQNGAEHLINPEKLLSSAARIYGRMMDNLWGDFSPVPPDHLSTLQDGDTVVVNGLRFQALSTPGHAEHHLAYIFDGVCFTGDIGGVRLQNSQHIRLPTPPPDFNLEKWRESLKRLRQADFTQLALTHFGIFSDRDRHLAAAALWLDDLEGWMQRLMPDEPPIAELNSHFDEWINRKAELEGLDMSLSTAYEMVNPSWMSVLGIERYWRKFRSR